ncbi:hypothetical protein TrRE_jg5406 [Triparma retinervis]|uniref:Molybdate-anion transporter n=1 Tax=Triparma retinervis TaxID=2557542 RepID=A0A9W7DX65_9STRA|nr:hypothetical protein TrRE_jg5406 [Triparma retinervis]
MLTALSGLCQPFFPTWPLWSINLLVTMLSALLAALFVTQRYGKKEGGVEEEKKKKKLTGKEKAEAEELRQDFDSFKAYYIGVYAVIMLADWMQGTHMYTLYLSYGVDISTLFLTGFLSGAIFAPFLGSVVDKVGRKNSCIVYCVLEIVINTMEHSTNFKILMFGRVLGGISTNLLFSAFESWMTTEHRKQGFPEDWLKEIYAAASVTNGVTAVAAGIVAQQLEDWLGHIGPFKGAVALTVLALILVLRWEENYGEDKGENSGSSVVTQFKEQFKEGWSATLSNPDILKIGLIQSLGEGAMYTFVFMWVPTLLSLAPNSDVPTGAVFSSLMIAITMGGSVFPLVHSCLGSTELAATATYFLAALCMLCPALCLSNFGNCFTPVLVAFVMVEFSIGLFFPAAGILRSKYVPDHLQGAILNIFRLPLNLLVVTGTKLTDLYQPSTVYSVVCCWYLVAAILQFTMTDTYKSLFNVEEKEEEEEEEEEEVVEKKPKRSRSTKRTPSKSTKRTPSKSTPSKETASKRTPSTKTPPKKTPRASSRKSTVKAKSTRASSRKPKKKGD